MLTFLLYAPSAGHGFIDYDDDTYILDNPHVLSGLRIANIFWAFRTGYGGNWHPITWLSHMLDCQLFGLDPGPPHFVNGLLHSANSVLLFLGLLRLTRVPWRSLFVAALFAVHPLHVESVAWLAERKDLLSGFFFMLTLLAYGNYVPRAECKGEDQSKVRNSKPETNPKVETRKIWYAAALILFALGLMAKPMLVTIPLLLLLLDYWPLRRISNRAGFLRMSLEKLPFLALSAFSSMLTLIVQKNAGAVASLENVPILTRFANSSLAYARYLGKIFWPENLMIPYVPEFNQGLVFPALAGCVLMAVTVILFLRRSGREYALVGWIWFLGTLVPVIGIVQVGIQSMADRYTYIPSIGIFILFAWTAADLLRHWQAPTIIVWALSVALPGVFAFVSSRQLAYWKNSETLFQHSAAIDPTNLPVTSLLAWTYATDPDPKIRSGQKAVALASFCVQQTQRREPWYLDVLAAGYAECGEFSLALETADEGLRLVGTNSGTEFASDLKHRIQLYKTGRAVRHP